MTEKEFMEEDYRKKMEEHHRKMEIRREKRRQQRNFHIFLGILIPALLILTFVGLRFALPYMEDHNLLSFGKKTGPSWEKEVEPLSSGSDITINQGPEESTEEPLSEKEEALQAAELFAKQYDYDKAIESLQALGTEDSSVSDKIAEYEAEKEKLVPADMDQITHIFFHILITDTDRALKDTRQGRQYNSVMTTIPEFKEIIKEMYERGYVMVHMHDIAEKQEQADGTK